jgi:hypothetical protein
MTRKEQARVGALLKHEYGPLVTVEVQHPCKALWITIEGPGGYWTANIADVGSPLLLFLLPDFPPSWPARCMHATKKKRQHERQPS